MEINLVLEGVRLFYLEWFHWGSETETDNFKNKKLTGQTEWGEGRAGSKSILIMTSANIIQHLLYISKHLTHINP